MSLPHVNWYLIMKQGPQLNKITALSVLFVCCMVVPLGAVCPKTTLEEQFASNRVVFVGRAIAQDVEAPEGRPLNTLTTFSVEEMWKGSLEKTITVRTCGGSKGDLALTCSESLAFQVGTRYLVFAAGQILETSLCVPTGPIERSEATLRWLADKPRVSDK